MERVGKRQVVDVEKGLFLVRYAAAEDALRPPKVSLSPEPGANSTIAFFLHPDHSEAAIWQPGGSIIVRAAARGRLVVDVTPTIDQGSSNATIRIEPLTQGNVALRRAQPDAGAPRDLGDFRLQGHVAGIGDVAVDADQWLAGPSNPSRIEGIAIVWPGKPADVDLRYSVRTARPQAISGRMTEVGAFAGTRGKGLPIVGLTVELAGAGATSFQLLAEAIFLGSPMMRVSGQRIVVEGPTSREPLVGLRLQMQRLAEPQRSEPGPSPQRRGSGRVRVFRNQAPANRTALG